MRKSLLLSPPWTRPMAPKPISLMGWRDMLMPFIKWRISQCPGLSAEIYNDHNSDALMIMVQHESRSYQMPLLTRLEMEGNIPHAIAGTNLDYAISQVFLPPAADTSEYDDIMQGQAIMDDLNG